MWPTLILVALASLTLGACQLSFELPEDSRLNCDSNADCPDGYICSLNFRLCLDAEPICGDGKVEFPEDCDVTVMTAECDYNCTTPVCGDGLHNILAGEACDDGNSNDDDACLTNCQYSPRLCGPDLLDCTVLFTPDNAEAACDGFNCTFNCLNGLCYDETSNSCDTCPSGESDAVDNADETDNSDTDTESDSE